jgi:ribosomal protein S18 acetylase RimI-like enzyme
MDTPALPHIPALIAAYMRAAAGSRPGSRIGPFTAGLDAHSDDPMRSYAVPDHDACPGAGDIDALITLFRHSHRVPRLEYIEEDAPRAWPALAAAGFTIERRTPVMIATPVTRLTPRSPAGITIRQATSDADLAAAAAVQHHAYQLPSPPVPHDIARLTRLTQRGGLVAIAVDESSGTVAGTGLIDVADDRPSVGDRPAVGELAAVGVLTAFRRRGIASVLSAHLAGTAHSQGISLVFLEAEPEEEQIYRRAGFTDATTKIWASIR